MSSVKRGPLPPAFFLFTLLLQWGLHRWIPIAQVVPEGWAILGTLPMAFGIGFMVAADRQFKKAATAINPFDEPSTLVVTGPFRVSRNPMYLAMVIVQIGAAVAWGTVSPFLVPPVLAWILARRFIAVEELAMARTFGDAYDAYKQRVRRWL